ncbi:MAG: glycosyltransferase, partial [Pseudonocardiaceae bacterium]
LLVEARLLVFPSLYEGFGMPLIEAMEAGLPVVAVRAGATPETVGNGGLLVEAGDVGALSGAMESAAFDDAVRSRLIQQGHRQAASFSWATAATASLALYRRVIAEHQS